MMSTRHSVHFLANSLRLHVNKSLRTACMYAIDVCTISKIVNKNRMVATPQLNGYSSKLKYFNIIYAINLDLITIQIYSIHFEGSRRNHTLYRDPTNRTLFPYSLHMSLQRQRPTNVGFQVYSGWLPNNDENILTHMRILDKSQTSGTCHITLARRHPRAHSETLNYVSFRAAHNEVTTYDFNISP